MRLLAIELHKVAEETDDVIKKLIPLDVYCPIRSLSNKVPRA
jgi:hypothetical protein